MRRGTTPTFKFTLPIDTSSIVAVYISVAQHRKIIIEKTIDDCTLDGNLISVKLTQDETLLLVESNTTEIQLRMRLADGSALASQIFSESTERILKDGEI